MEHDDGDVEPGGASAVPRSATLKAVTKLLDEAAAEGHRVLVLSQMFADVLDGGDATPGGHLTADEIRGLVS